MDSITQFLLPVIIFLLTLASGVWLTQTGKPLNTAIFTLHKLIALAAVVLTGIQMVGMLKNTDVPALPIALIILTGLCVLALFATGALMSTGKPTHILLLTLHRTTPILMVISVGVTIYLQAK